MSKIKSLKNTEMSKYNQLSGLDKGKLINVGRLNCQLYNTRTCAWGPLLAASSHGFDPTSIYRYISEDSSAVSPEPEVFVEGLEQVIPKLVIFNDPATIVMWPDGEKTVVKAMEFDKFNPVTGMLMAFFVKFSGLTHADAKRVIFQATDCYEGEHIQIDPMAVDQEIRKAKAAVAEENIKRAKDIRRAEKKARR